MEKIEKNFLWFLQPEDGDRLKMAKSRMLKRWVRDCDPVRSWPVDDRLDRIRKGVMQSIASAEIGEE